MEIGPLQLVVIGFDDDDNGRGQIKEELAAASGRGAIRLLDVLFVHRDHQGSLAVIEDSDLNEAELVEYGRALKRLFSLAATPGSGGNKGKSGSKAVGLKASDVKAVANKIKPGTAAALLLFEHAWAAGLAAAANEAGGRVLAQGFLTSDVVYGMGEDLEAVVGAERVVEASQAVKAAAFINAVAFGSSAGKAQNEIVEQATMPAADEITTRTAARTLRALAAAGVVDDTELETAIMALIDGGLLSPELVARGVEAAQALESSMADLAAAQQASAR